MAEVEAVGHPGREGAAGATLPGPVPGSGEERPPPRAARARVEPFVLVASAVVAVAVPTVAALDVQFPGRVVLALLFVLVVPGVPLVALLRIPDGVLAASLAGAVSLAVVLLTGTAAAVGQLWNPLAWCAGTAALHLAVTPWALRRVIRSARGDEAWAAEPRGPRAPTLRNRVLSTLALLDAVALWWLATRWTHLGDAGATGVAGVIGWPYLAAVGVVAVVAAVQLRRPQLDPLMLAATAVVMALVIFGFVNVADSQASVPTAWHHVGFVRYIDVHGTSFFGLDARASWPGFFAAAAQLVPIAGLPDATALLRLSPFFYNAAAIAPLLVIARSVTASRRLAWLSIFIYLGANWFQQDYFSPQATAFLLYLVILATMMWAAANAVASHPPLPPHRRRSRGPRALPSRSPPAAGTSSVSSSVSSSAVPDDAVAPGRLRTLLAGPRRRLRLAPGLTPLRSIALEGTLVVLSAAIVVSHQLTPVTLALTLLIFVLTRKTRYRQLWLIVGLLFLGWLSFGAVDYWSGHLSAVFGDIGQLGSNVNSGVTSRVTGDATYQLMQEVRLLWSVVYLVLAVVGMWLVRRRPNALLIGLIAASTASLVSLQSYGGEVVLRVFVFAAPVLAPLAARACRGLTGRRAAAGFALAALIGVYGLMGTVTRGVNIAFERVTTDDVAAAQVLWSHVHKGDTLGYLSSTGAYSADRIGQWTVVSLDQADCQATPLRCAEQKRPKFILVSRSQDAEQQLLHGAPPGEATRMADRLVGEGLYRVLYQGADARLLILAGTAGGGR